MCPHTNFNGCVVIHPVVQGARHYKVPASGRLDFPPAALKLKRLWKVAIAGGMSGGVSLADQCALARTSVTLRTACSRQRGAPLCLLSWQPACTEQLFEQLGPVPSWREGGRVSADLADLCAPCGC